jgi:hypothetical protein
MVAAAAAAVSAAVHLRTAGHSDFAQIWAAGRLLLDHGSPYTYPLLQDWPLPLVYPLPAVVALLPLAVLPEHAADAAFAALGAGTLAYAVARTSPRPDRRWLMLVSAPFVEAIIVGQWSPLVVGASMLPWAAVAYACKPTTGLPLFCAKPRVRDVLVGLACVAVTIAIRPAWPHEWWASIAAVNYAVAPLVVGVGPVILLALLRWKRPEARLLLALAAVPHTTLVYEALPLSLVPQSWMEGLIVWLGCWAALIAQRVHGPFPSQTAAIRYGAVWLTSVVYLPCVVMILRRPNTSPQRSQNTQNN